MNDNISTLPLTVTQLNNQVKRSLHQQYKNIDVLGEINNFKRYSSGHVYFTLKDKTSEISSVMFDSYYQKMNIDLKDGDKIVVSGDVTLYLAKGNYQFLAKKIQFINQKGDIYKEYEKLKKKLDLEGLFKSDYKKKIPPFPTRIGVVTSLDGAVIKDIVNIAKRRSENVDLVLSPTSVQGADAHDDIIQAVYKLLEYHKNNEIDVIIIARGGGSFEDLNCFNNENLARVVFNLNIPIISAIGHETDFTILDFVSDLRASTPSEAAELSIPDNNEVIQSLDLIIDQILQKTTLKIIKYKDAYNVRDIKLKRLNPETLVENYRFRLTTAKDKMTSFQKNIYNNIRDKIKYYNKLLYHNNPYNILNKGFAVISDKDNKFIKKVSDIDLNESINIKLQDGIATANIESKKYGKEKK